MGSRRSAGVAGKWIDEGRVEGVAEQVRTMFENPDGSVWAGTADDGVIRVTLESRPGPNVPRPAMRSNSSARPTACPPGASSVNAVGGAPIFSAGFEDPHLRAVRRGVGPLRPRPGV